MENRKYKWPQLVSIEAGHEGDILLIKTGHGSYRWRFVEEDHRTSPTNDGTKKKLVSGVDTTINLDDPETWPI